MSKKKKTKPKPQGWKPRTLWERKPQTQVVDNGKAKESKNKCRGRVDKSCPYACPKLDKMQKL